MTTEFNTKTFGFLALALVLGLGSATASSPVLAYDDDVEVVCWDHDDGETECESVDDLAAECEMSDPEYTTEQCGGLLENHRPKVVISSLIKTHR